ncbi:MAG: hypothetical protein CM15mV24_2050 [Bellamyvirus sp.]|nr:MAG: hypothetical protein CM15mV24_2050 [Bellamyvirus sp.]
MARAVKIFGDAGQGSLFFEGSPHPPAPLGGVVVATALAGSTTKIKVTRSDLLQKNGVDPRVIFKRMKITRVRNKANQRLVQDLGYDQSQVIDYINDEANRKANEVDFQKNGTLVGSGNTLNFTGGIEDISVSGDVSTIRIPQVGISSTSGYVGTGVTLFHFKGSGVSTVTSVVGGATTIFFEGGGSSGNPVTSGAVTGAGNTTLRLTLQDATNVDIDVTSMRSTTSIGSSTAYFFLNNGAQLANNQHDKDGGVVFYGTKVKRGEELVFAVPSAALHVGVWGGGNGITGISNVHDRSNWTTKFRYSSEDTRWQNASTDIGKQGVDISTDIETDANTFAVRFDYDSQKLQLWEIDTAFDWHVATANVAVGATETYIYFSSGGSTQTTPPASLPGITTHRSAEWERQSYVNAPVGPTIYTGVQDDDIWKSTRSLRPGMKLKTTLSSDTKIHHWGVGYGGTVGSGNGPLNPYSNATGSWRSSNSTELRAEENSTFNNKYTAAVDGSTNSTLDLSGRNISWRYNSNNSWDVFDEDTDEVILTGDTNLDGGDMYPYLFGASTINTYATEIPQWEWEWNAAQWFIEYRDWESGRSTITYISKIPGAKPLKTGPQAIPTQNNGFYYLGNARYKVTWGEKMRPGQEFSWTQLADNSHGASKHNMIIGVLNSDSDDFTHGVRFHQNGELKVQSLQDSGFTVQAGITTTTAGQSCRLKYDASDNKLKLDVVRSGVRETLAVSDSALDGNPIFISMGGESTRLPTAQGVSVYGWETVHEGVGHYNPWGNWRIGGFPENEGLGVGVTAGVLAYKADQVWRHKDGIPQGRKMHWTLPTTSSILKLDSGHHPMQVLV